MAVSGVSSTQNTSGTNSNDPISLASQGIDTTFLNLLTTELQAQDPTAPMDSNTMITQMVSLNQLDQLIAIRQELQPSTTTSTSTTQSGSNTTGGQ